VAVGSEHAAPLVRHCSKEKKDWVKLMRSRMEKIRDTTFILQLIRSEYTSLHRL